MTTAVADLELPKLEYEDPSLRGPAFHEAMRELRERSWLVRVEPIGFAVLDREAAAHFLRTRSATFPGRLMLELQGVTEGPIYERFKGNLLDLDGDDHRRLRKLVQPSFSPQGADRHRPVMRTLVESLYERVADAGRCDVVEAFAQPYPAMMIAYVMGAPLEDAGRMHQWANLIQQQFDPVKIATQLDRINAASQEFADYTRELLRARRGDPGDDLISELLAAEEEGDRLTEEECVHLVSAILVGGVDTTQSQLAHGMLLFAQHPDQWDRLGAEPSLAPQAVEEVLRYDPITPFTARITLEDVEYRGVTFPQGTVVIASAVTANRDPDAYDDPESFDITADRDRSKPLTFGAGPHFCLGANLARAELQEAFGHLAPRMRDLELDGEPRYDTPFGVYGMERLPIRWRAA
ncbi:MAG: cytochrome P450 [Actinomycetota bacterium]|nr:cytochrome P450 [Actinomycetota bacterium]